MDVWNYSPDATSSRLWVSRLNPKSPITLNELRGWDKAANPYANHPYTLDTRCFTSTLQGQDTVAGRPTYVLLMQPRDDCANGCWVYQSRYMRFMKGQQQLWLDAETYLPLKYKVASSEAQPYGDWEMTSIRYKVGLNPNSFRFTPPTSLAGLEDTRPEQISKPTDVRRIIGEDARYAPYATFLPTYTPPKNRLLAIGYQARDDVGSQQKAGLRLTYYASGVTLKQVSLSHSGLYLTLTINQQPAANAVYDDGTLQPTTIAGQPALAGSNSDGAVVRLVRNGTLIELRSGADPARSPSLKELVKVAASLVPATAK